MKQDTTCIQCGTPFSPKRASAKFCSDACRLKYYRAKEAELEGVSPAPIEDKPIEQLDIFTEPPKPKPKKEGLGGIIMKSSMLETSNPKHKSQPEDYLIIQEWQSLLRQFKAALPIKTIENQYKVKVDRLIPYNELTPAQSKDIAGVLLSLKARAIASKYLTVNQVDGIIARIENYFNGEYDHTRVPRNLPITLNKKSNGKEAQK